MGKEFSMEDQFGGLLTPRQIEVLTLVSGGMKANEIAKQLKISRRTVEHLIDGDSRHKVGIKGRLSGFFNGKRPSKTELIILVEKRRLELD